MAFTSEISAIVDVTLSYCGYTIEDLAKNSTFEEVAFLCGSSPAKDSEWKDWQKEIRSNYELPGAHRGDEAFSENGISHGSSSHLREPAFPLGLRFQQ